MALKEEIEHVHELTVPRLGDEGYRKVRERFEGGAVVFEMEPKKAEIRCPGCRSRRVIRKGRKTRRFRTLPIGRRPVFLEAVIPRVHCRDCGIVRQIRLSFAEPRRGHTRSFARLVLDLSGHMTMLAVALFLKVGWDVVKEIQKKDLERRFGRPRLSGLKWLAIDEISIGKGHRYLTVVMDLKGGRVVFVGEGKGGDALDPFWKRLRRSRAKIEAVAIDMGTAYIKAVQANLPGAVIVFDHFHIIKLFNDKLSKLRRDLQREAEGPLEMRVLKGTRWLLLKKPENLEEGWDERQRLEEALALNKPLATAYYLKEDLRRIWSQPDKQTAMEILQGWIAQAEASGIHMLKQMGKTLATYRNGILAF